MIRVPRSGTFVLVAITLLAEIGCQVQLRRPNTTPTRMIEPQVLEPQNNPVPATQIIKAANAAPVRLLDTQALGHIGRPLLRQQASGELTEDAVWRWSSAPDRYLDTALRLAIESSPNLRLVDTSRAPELAATLLVWDLEEKDGTTRLVGSVEFQAIGTDRVVHIKVVRASKPIGAELPSDLAAAAGDLLRRLASEGVTWIASER
jgi:hypothetical protein